jgi:carbonic anhydrase/acetyltransferase-like protein (isoleucine patch superfamily)
VTVGHGATLHGCRIESHCLIGMGAIILNGATIGSESIVAAGALVPEGMQVPPRSVVMGTPGRFRRQVTDEEREGIRRSAANYFDYKETYLAETAKGA